MIEAALLAAVAMAFAPARAASPDTAPAAPPEGIVIDCDRPVLPSQKTIGELAEQHNFGQVYATRQRAMVEVQRACLREGVSAVLLVGPKKPTVTAQEPHQIAANRAPSR
ncbi:hypothetical protein WQ53_08160 [Pseudoxanthomonas suwonensis]|uniref:Uncharacterized protein n=2 Tax=Pseudoxanthomonas suwonensis TaxID=314722 RepID=A0A0E3Z3I0_9GAMM|nr:hypothetical protein WQ53_08160 [Pseudoxanthomonas suwonensis]